MAQSKARELNDAGWKLIQSGDARSRGATCSPRRSRSRPTSRCSCSGPGVAAHLQGRSKDASVPLKRALDLDPRLTAASILLGQIAYTDGDVAAAIAIYEKALTHAPNEPHLTTKLKSWRADAEASRGFTERRFDRFRVSFQGHADQQLATRATEILESAFWRIGKALGAYPSEPVVVLLYTEQQFRDVTLAPTWAGGVYDGRIRVPAAGAAQSPQLFERVLVHELGARHDRDHCTERRPGVAARRARATFRGRRRRGGPPDHRQDWRDSPALPRRRLQRPHGRAGASRLRPESA